MLSRHMTLLVCHGLEVLGFRGWQKINAFDLPSFKPFTKAQEETTMSKNSNTAAFKDYSKVAFSDKELESERKSFIKSLKATTVAAQNHLAKCAWMLIIHGRAEPMNKLHAELKAENLSYMADMIRSVFMPELINRFGVGGKTNHDTTFMYSIDAKGEAELAFEDVKWITKPTPFIGFSTKAYKDAEGNDQPGYYKPSAKDMTPENAENVKMARVKILKAGPEALDFVWTTRGRSNQNENAFTAKDILNRFATMAATAASHTASTGVTKDQLIGLLENVERITGIKADQKQRDKIVTAKAAGSKKSEAHDESADELAELLKAGENIIDGEIVDELDPALLTSQVPVGSEAHVN